MARVIVFTDEPVTAEGLATVLSEQNGFEIAAVCGSGRELVRVIGAVQPDLLVVDFCGNLSGGLLSRIAEEAPKCRVVLWVREIPVELAYQAVALGVSGILKKTGPPETFLGNLRRIAAGETCIEPVFAGVIKTVALTRRESQLLALVSRGLKNREISRTLSLSQGTVKVYLSRLFHKTGVRDRYQLALYGVRNLGLASTEPDGRSLNGRHRDPALPRSLVVGETLN